MSLIYTHDYGNGYVDVFCFACHASVGTFTVDEAAELARQSIHIYCFACDGLRADEIHPALLGNQEGELLCIGNARFFCNHLLQWERITADLFLAVAHGLGGGWAENLLSSTTNLNTARHNVSEQ